MKRSLFAVVVLALGAGGVVWIAVKQRPAPARARPTADIAVPASGVVSASASASSSASAKPAADSGQSFPPLAPNAAWSVVRWDMSAAKVEVAFEDAGFDVADATDAKTGAKRLRVKRGAWEATIDFDAKSPSQIVVAAESVSKEVADAVVTKMKERAPVTKTIELTEWRWVKDTGEGTTLAANVDGATATMRELHVRERAPGGAIGFAGLRWGQSTQEVVGQLEAAGYRARVVKAPETVPFTKGDVEGMASFNQFGVRRVEVSGPTGDRAAARAKELESSLGKPASTEVSTKTEYVDDARATWIQVEVSEKRPGEGLALVETYRPKK